MVTVLITGYQGQIGKALLAALRRGPLSNCKITGVDINKEIQMPSQCLLDEYRQCDVRRSSQLKKLIVATKADWVFHLPAILSGAAEENISLCRQTLRINVRSQELMLQLSYQHGFRLFCPSTIGAFGPEAPKTAPDVTTMAPKYLYGITKVYNELLGDYFHNRYQVDYRSLRLPGILSKTASIGTGTTGSPSSSSTAPLTLMYLVCTDYAIAMLRAAQSGEDFKCYVDENVALPMIHIDDCVDGIIRFMSCDRALLKRSVYNIHGVSFSPKELHQAIENISRTRLVVNYECDYRNDIAKSWPDRLNDANARKDWGWNPRHTLESIVSDMLGEIREN